MIRGQRRSHPLNDRRTLARFDACSFTATRRQLPPRPRMVMTLKYQEDLDPSDIAALLNVPINTVKSDLRRSLAVLRHKLAHVEAV